MKNLIASVIVLTTFAFASCTKTQVAPQNNAPNYQIAVEYQIESESGHFTCEYNLPDANNQMNTQSYQIDRTNYSVKFNTTNGNLLSIKAHNTIGSSKDVKVTILVNGVTFKFGEANAPGAVASAEGRY